MDWSRAADARRFPLHQLLLLLLLLLLRFILSYLFPYQVLEWFPGSFQMPLALAEQLRMP